MISHCLWQIYIRLCSFHFFWHHLTTFTFTHLQDSYHDISRDCVVSFWVGERHQNSSENWSTLGMSYVMWLWQVRTNVDLSFNVSVIVFQLIFLWFIMTMVTLVFDVFTLFMWFKTAPLTCNSVTPVTFKFSTNTLVCAQQMLLSFFTITLFTFKQSWEGMCGKSTK